MTACIYSTGCERNIGFGEGLEGHVIGRASARDRLFDFPVFPYLFPDPWIVGL